MNRVRVEIPEVQGDTLVGPIESDGAVNRFFSGKPFRTTYSTDIEGIPEHIRPIPVLAQVCPVAWATGADVVVETVDAEFLEALRRIRSQFLEMYPEFMEGGAIRCSDPVQDNRGSEASDGAGMLFTGGVDSMATYIRHREEDPTLVSVRGWIIGLDETERWDRTRDYVNSFAEESGNDADFVESNMLDFLSIPLLQAHYQRHLDGTWYSAVGHGLGLLGLCAPLASTQDWASLYIASSHTPEWSRPWGSHPDIDNEVTWNGTACSHDGWELSRQEKIDQIAEYVEPESTSVPLRTCIFDDGAGNCGECEKCYRTILGLLLAGLDPNKHGYGYDPETLAKVRYAFENGEWNVKSHTRYHWDVLQEVARTRDTPSDDGAAEFFDWFDDQDLQSYVENSKKSLRYRLIQLIARNTPTPVYSTLYPLYRRMAGFGV